MKNQNEFWRVWWDEQARNATSDFELNRRTGVRLPKLEERANRLFLESVDPQATDRVLDAGCGSGRNLEVLGPLVREITGVDYSGQMIERARERVTSCKLANVQLLQGDISKLPFPSESFDKVVCASVLQYLDSDSCSRALTELLRVCKPGGRLILHVKNGASLYALSLAILRPVARAFGKEMKPEFYRTISWYLQHVGSKHPTVLNHDGFGILTFVPLPARVVRWFLNCEASLPIPTILKKVAVNCQMTLQIPIEKQ